MKVAIVEDKREYARQLNDYLKQFCAERNIFSQVYTFSNAVAFLENYSADYDIVFIDIRMPYLNGMEAAKVLREKDADVMIIFVSSFAQYAVQGYSVQAFDYLIKPVSYPDFTLTMTRAIGKLHTDGNSLFFPMLEGNVRLSASEIIYVETSGHRLIYHTTQRDYTRYATISLAEKELLSHGFALCNRCYLVNLALVENIKGYIVTVHGIPLQISQPKKKSFLAAVESLGSK